MCAQPAGMRGRAAAWQWNPLRGPSSARAGQARKRPTALVGGRVVMAGADASEQVNQEVRRPPPGIDRPSVHLQRKAAPRLRMVGGTHRPPTIRRPKTERWTSSSRRRRRRRGPVPPPDAMLSTLLGGRWLRSRRLSAVPASCTAPGGGGLGVAGWVQPSLMHAFPGKATATRQQVACPLRATRFPLPTLAAVPLAALPVGLRGAAWHAQRVQERTAPQAPHDDSSARSSASKACHQRAARHVPNTAGMGERRPQAAQLTVEHARVMQQLVEILLGKGRGAGDETAQRPAVCACSGGAQRTCVWAGERRAAAWRVDRAPPIPAPGASARWRPQNQTAADHSAQQARQQQRGSEQHPQGGERHL